jgi:hypothetical protein
MFFDEKNFKISFNQGKNKQDIRLKGKLGEDCFWVIFFSFLNIIQIYIPKQQSFYEFFKTSTIYMLNIWEKKFSFKVIRSFSCVVFDT